MGKLVAELKILGLPKMTNSQKSHWRLKHKEAVKWKSAVGTACFRAGISDTMLLKAKLTLTRHSSREPDFDGLVSGFKHPIDGLVEARVLIDDKYSVIGQSSYVWEYSPTKSGGFITIKIETVD